MRLSNASPPISPESTALRLTFLSALVISIFVLIVARLWFLQVMTGERFVARADNQTIRTVQIDAPRGDIVDVQGRPVVDSRFAQVVSVRRDQMGDEETQDRVISELAEILSMSEEAIRERIDDQRAGPFANRPIAFDVPNDVIFYIHQNGPTRFPGVIAERIPLRDYPYGSSAAHVVGYTGEVSAEELEEPRYADYDPGDEIGWAGVERTYEEFLHGTKGERRVRVNALGEILEDVGEPLEAIPGDTVQLTLDIEVQQIVEQALVQGIEEARATRDNEVREAGEQFFVAPGGAAIVLDPSNGEVVAMASYPDFEPNDFVGGISQRNWDFLQDSDNDFPLINRAIASSYPPGSVYKIVSASAALAYGFADQNSYIQCPPEYEWNGSVYRNWFRGDDGSLNLAESLMRSCDTVFYFLARQMFNAEVNTEEGQGYNSRLVESLEDGEVPPIPFEYMAEMSRAWGLDEPSGIDLPGERGGVIPGREWRAEYWLNARDSYCYQRDVAAPGSYGRELFTELCSPQGALWRGGDGVNMSIGQGDVQTTPLQIANTFAAIANRGPVYTPHVVRAVYEHGTNEVLQTYEPEVAFTVPVEPEDLDFLEQGLVMVTTAERGTATKVFQDFPITIAGKTGTAEQKPKQPFAWFAGYNMEEINGRTYVVVALVEEGGGGSLTAAPIVEQIFGGIAGLEVEFELGEVTD